MFRVVWFPKPIIIILIVNLAFFLIRAICFVMKNSTVIDSSQSPPTLFHNKRNLESELKLKYSDRRKSPSPFIPFAGKIRRREYPAIGISGEGYRCHYFLPISIFKKYFLAKEDHSAKVQIRLGRILEYWKCLKLFLKRYSRKRGL